MNKLVVIGVGQTMRGDDGVGVIAVQSWQAQYPQTAALPEIRVEIAELPGLDLLELLSGADHALIVDAVKSRKTAGEIHILDEQAISAFDPGAGSAHGWGVAETIRLGRTLKRDDLPQQIRLIGIEASQFETGARLTPEIFEYLPQIVPAIEAQVKRFLQATRQNH